MTYPPPPPGGQPPQYGQPQYGPLPGQVPYPAPPKSRRGLWIGLGIGTAVVLLLCCGGLGVLGYLGYQASRSPEAVAASWLDHLQQRDYQAAYDLLCRDRRAAAGPAEFAATFTGGESLVDYTVERGSARTAGGRSEVDVTVTLAGAPAPSAGRLVLASEGGDWKVCDTIGFG